MANIKTGVCPSCGKERELAYIKFGVIQATMCPYCLNKYLSRSILPRLQQNNDESTDKCHIEAYQRNNDEKLIGDGVVNK